MMAHSFHVKPYPILDVSGYMTRITMKRTTWSITKFRMSKPQLVASL